MLLKQSPAPYEEALTRKTKLPSVVVVREDECIGCTKCIQACPVDAIVGASKKMHTVITDACTGCDLCIEPCPVDCIDQLPIQPIRAEHELVRRETWRARYVARNERLERYQHEKDNKHQQAKLSANPNLTLDARRDAIKACMQRSLAKIE